MSPAEPLRPPEPLTAEHEVEGFDCGVEALNSFLINYALANQQNNTARTYVACRGNRVVGYYSLAAASAEIEHVPKRVARGLARHPVPLTLLARLAVQKSERGIGLGAGLLKDAFMRFLAGQEVVASRALVTHAKDDSARDFYLRYGFEPSPIDEYHLYMLTKDIRKTLELG